MVTINSGYFSDPTEDKCLLIDTTLSHSDYVIQDGSPTLYEECEIICNSCEEGSAGLEDLYVAQADYSILPPEDSVKSFLRLPPTVKRGGREWLLAVTLTSSYSPCYEELSARTKTVEVSTPRVENFYANESQAPVGSHLYEEGYLISDTPGLDEAGLGWTGSDIHDDFRFQRGFDPATVEEEVVESRRTVRGRFYRKLRPVTGYLYRDIGESRVELIKTPPELDLSIPKYRGKILTEDYSRVRVCYAYLTADLSAVDDPVFDPSYG